MEGVLEKRSEWLKSWNSRYFHFDGTQLVYYDKQGGKKKGMIELSNCIVATTDLCPFSFLVQTPAKDEFHLRAKDDATMRQWISHIHIASRKEEAPQPSNATADSTSSALTGLLNGTHLGGTEDTATGVDDPVDAPIPPPNASTPTDMPPSLVSSRLPDRPSPVNDAATVHVPPAPVDATDPLSYLAQLPDSKPKPGATTTRATPPRAAQTPKPKVATTKNNTQRKKSDAPSFFGLDDNESFDHTGDGLRNAIKAGRNDVIRDIIQAKPELAQYCDQQQQSMLHLACIFGNSAVAKLLVKNGADPHLENKQGETPLSISPPTLRETLENLTAALPKPE